MPKTTSEQNLENTIVADLMALNQFQPAGPEDYDRELCLIPKSLVRFLQVTQPQAWKALRTELGDEAESRVVKRVLNVIEKKGTLHALRKGVDESGCHFELCFQPLSGLGDAELEKLHAGNFFQVLRSEDSSGGFNYSLENEKSLDLGISLNGLPIFTTEVKNPVSGQNVARAIAQYQNVSVWALPRAFRVGYRAGFHDFHPGGQEDAVLPIQSGNCRGSWKFAEQDRDFHRLPVAGCVEQGDHSRSDPVQDDDEISKELFDRLLERYYRKKKS